MALTGIKTVKAGFKQHTGSWEVPNRQFVETYHALQGIAAVTGALSFIQDTITGAWHAIRDMSHHSERKQTQTLLRLYNPQTRKLVGHPKHQKTLQQRLVTTVSDLSRSQSQVAVDHLVRAKDLLAQGTSTAESSLIFAGGFSSTAAKAIPVFGIVSSAIATAHSAIKTGTQVVALNNLAKAKAKAATNDPLLKALAGHIKQERTIEARKHLLNTAIGAAFTGVSVGLTATGVGAPAALIATGALGTATGLGTMAFDLYHNRKLTKAREGSETLMAVKESLAALARGNIGVAEKAFLLRLRSAEGKALSDCIEFLRDFGVTDSTIKKLQLAPEKIAMKSLQAVLYRDKVKFKGSGSTGHSLAFNPEQRASRQSRLMSHRSSLRHQPAYATVPNHFRYGRILS